MSMSPRVVEGFQKAVLPSAALIVLALISIGSAVGGERPDPAAVGNQVPVTLSARDLDIREVLAMLSDSRGLNIVSGSEVRGSVSFELRDVPFQEALTAIVAMAGFEISRKGNIYFIRQPMGEDPRVSLMRESRTFRLDYASPNDVLPVVQAALSPDGQAQSYEPLRAIVVEDRPDVIGHVGEIITSLDHPPRQVLIEAQVLEVRLSRDLRFGIDWSLIFSTNGGAGEVTVEGFASPPGSGQGLFVTWGKGDFASSLEALEGVEELSTLAAPQLLAIDGAEAQIIIGEQLGFPVVTTVENTVIQSVEFLDTGTQLKLTPTIAGDGYVMMAIHPELSNGKVEAGLPSKTTTQVTTKVLVKDGHTIFVGGLIGERDEVTRKGIPVLMRIPILGALFGRTTHTLAKSEIVALITPRIVQPGQEVAARSAGLVEPPFSPEARVGQ